MAFCTRTLLEEWLDEFEADGPGRGGAYVAEQEPVEGRDGGLVIYPLTHSGHSVYIQPTAPDSLDWCVTIEAHPEDTIFSTHRLRELCQDLSAAAILCDFLQGKAFAHHVLQAGDDTPFDARGRGVSPGSTPTSPDGDGP